MKRLAFLFLLCLTCSFATATTTASQDDKQYALKVKELLEVTHSFDATKPVLAQQYKAMKSQIGLNDHQCDLLADEVIVILLNHSEEIFVPVYKKYFTLEELNGILAFYRTPLGKKMADSMVFLTNETMTQVQQVMPMLGGEIMEAVERVKTK